LWRRRHVMLVRRLGPASVAEAPIAHAPREASSAARHALGRARLDRGDFAAAADLFDDLADDSHGPAGTAARELAFVARLLAARPPRPPPPRPPRPRPRSRPPRMAHADARPTPRRRDRAHRRRAPRLPPRGEGRDVPPRDRRPPQPRRTLGATQGVPRAPLR